MFGIGGGIEKVNKILMPLFFFLFLGLGVYIAFQPGAVSGYHYIFRIDPEAFLNPQVIIYAMGQAFFSLSVAGNGTLIYGSPIWMVRRIFPHQPEMLLFSIPWQPCWQRWF